MEIFAGLIVLGVVFVLMDDFNEWTKGVFWRMEKRAQERYLARSRMRIDRDREDGLNWRDPEWKKWAIRGMRRLRAKAEADRARAFRRRSA